jgi:hypothetical protein
MSECVLLAGPHHLPLPKRIAATAHDHIMHASTPQINTAKIFSVFALFLEHERGEQIAS